MSRFFMFFFLLSLSCSTRSANTAKSDSPDLPSATATSSHPNEDPTQAKTKPLEGEKFAVFASGCFWCTEKDFEEIEGVRDAVSGYTGGSEENPTYKQVGRGLTTHTEGVKVYYDPNLVTYEQLVEKLWMTSDPTDNEGQFVDRGQHYRPGIFYGDLIEKEIAEKSKKALQESGRFSKPIVLKIEKLGQFWPAEDYHQDFYKKSPKRYYQYRRGSGRDLFIKKHWQ